MTAAAVRDPEGDGIAEAVVRAAPWLVVGYGLALLLLRLSLSPFLEVDEAQFVGHVDLRLVYANSHPPLYNWMLRGLLEATGWNWPLSTGALKYGLLVGFYLLSWDAARRLGGAWAGALAVAAAAFLPQIVWQSAHTLAHSIMVLTGAAALIHATALVWLRPSAWSYVWFGAAAAFGAMAKFNFFLFAVPLLIALAATPEVRARFFRKGAWLSLGVFAALTAPVLVAAVGAVEDSTERMAKLYSKSGTAVWYDAPGVGVDGFISLLVAILAWAGPLALIWGAARWAERAPATKASAPANRPLLRALGLAMAIGVGVFAAIVLIGDMHKVHERYLTPILAGLPVWIAVASPLERFRSGVLVAAGAAFAAALVGVLAMTQTQKHRYAIPYGAAAAEIAAAGGPAAPIFARRHSDVANLTIALGWPGAESPRYAALENQALVVWRGGAAQPRRGVAPEGFVAVGEKRTVRFPYRNWRDDSFELSFQWFRRP